MTGAWWPPVTALAILGSQWSLCNRCVPAAQH